VKKKIQIVIKLLLKFSETTFVALKGGFFFNSVGNTNRSAMFEQEKKK
jgi:hypothetical protein